MRVSRSTIRLCFAMSCCVPTGWSLAAQADITRQQASDRVLADGFALVSRTEAVPGLWDVWASKNGLPYEVTIDAATGSIVTRTPIADD